MSNNSRQASNIHKNLSIALHELKMNSINGDHLTPVQSKYAIDLIEQLADCFQYNLIANWQPNEEFNSYDEEGSGTL